MPGLPTKAYVIKTADYRDTSLLVTLYTKDFGKIRAVIKGGRDGRGRLGSTLEPFSLNDVLVYKRKRGDLHLVTQAELIERFNGVREDLTKLGVAVYFLELIDQLVDEEPHQDLFLLMGDALDHLGRTQDASLTARVFEIKLSAMLGLMPELESCIVCQAKDPADALFAVRSGGIVCPACREKESPLVLTSPEAIRSLKNYRRLSFSEVDHAKDVLRDRERMEQMMRQFMDCHLAYKPKSLVYLEKLKKDQKTASQLSPNMI